MDHQGEDYSGSRIIVQGQRGHILSNTPLSPKSILHICVIPKRPWLVLEPTGPLFNHQNLWQLIQAAVLPEGVGLLPFWSTIHTMKPLSRGLHFLFKMLNSFQGLEEGLGWGGGAPTLADPQSKADKARLWSLMCSFHPATHPWFSYPRVHPSVSPTWICWLSALDIPHLLPSQGCWFKLPRWPDDKRTQFAHIWGW